MTAGGICFLLIFVRGHDNIIMIEINGEKYRELRCAKCRKLICYENVRGKLCFICPRCGETNSFHFTDLKEWKKSNKLKALQVYKKGGE